MLQELAARLDPLFLEAWHVLHQYWAYIAIITGMLVLVVAYYMYLMLTNSGDPVKLFRKLNSMPFGGWAFVSGVSFFSPYTGSIRPSIDKLEYTGCTARIRQFRAIQNPFNSVHLAALVNFGEMTAAMPFLSAATKSKKRAIPIAVNADFVKKSTGTLCAKCENIVVDNSPKQVVPVQITNSKGELCATVRITFAVSDKPTKKDN